MVDDGSSCKSSIPLVAKYPAGKENGVVLCIPDNILNVGQLGCIVREHLGSISWTQSILHLMLFDSFESYNPHFVQEHKCVPTHAMALEMIWNACTFSIRICIPDNILNVGQLGCIVREHLGSISWTQSILHLVLFDSFESYNPHFVQEHKCVPTHAMALEMIWNACTFSIRISSLIFLC